MKKDFFILGVLISLGMFCACSSDDEVIDENDGQSLISRNDTINNNTEMTEEELALADYCFDGTYTTEFSDGRIVVWVDENPIEVLSKFGLCWIAFQKTDLPERDYKEGDHIFFKIKKHSEGYEEYEFMFGWGMYVRYNCVVEPC